VELSNPINNLDMVEVLNKVRQQVLKLASESENLLGVSNDPALEGIYNNVSARHLEHGRKLADTILFLGGSPASSKNIFKRPGDPFRNVSAAENFVLEFMSNEEELIRSCKKGIERLVGSSESVEVLNIVKSDAEKAIDKLSGWKKSS
jgi:bacterioferritin (cytochrome b1)